MSTEEDFPKIEDYPWLVGATPAQMTDRYVQLRDAKKQYEDSHKKQTKETYANEMDVIERELLTFLANTGIDSVKTKSGTAYRYEASSVSVADSREFQRHVIGQEHWDLIDWRANKTAVNQIVEAGDDLPPGVNFSKILKLGIRRPE